MRVTTTASGFIAWATFWPGYNGRGYEPDEPAEMRIEAISYKGRMIDEDDMDEEILIEIYKGLWDETRNHRPQRQYHGNNNLDAIGRGVFPILD